jgi:hypothetical protein
MSELAGTDVTVWGQKSLRATGWDKSTYSKSVYETRSPQVKEAIDLLTKELHKIKDATGNSKFSLIQLFDGQEGLGYQLLLNAPIPTKQSHARDRVQDFSIEIDSKQNTKDKLAYLMDELFVTTSTGGNFICVIAPYDTELEIGNVATIDKAICILSADGFMSVDDLLSVDAPRSKYDKDGGYDSFAVKITNPQTVLNVRAMNLLWDRIWKYSIYYRFGSFKSILEAHMTKLHFGLRATF